jgi:hypothetical protein
VDIYIVRIDFIFIFHVFAVITAPDLARCPLLLFAPEKEDASASIDHNVPREVHLRTQLLA